MTDTRLQWDDAFRIGIDELDYEHRALIEDINRLHQELARHDETSRIEACLGDIYARMQAHFALEERVMKERGYRFFQEHKREHDELLERYTDAMLRFMNDPDATDTRPLEATLEHWIVDHILSSDKKMSQMVREK